jgi:hypothetical protein
VTVLRKKNMTGSLTMTKSGINRDPVKIRTTEHARNVINARTQFNVVQCTQHTAYPPWNVASRATPAVFALPAAAETELTITFCGQTPNELPILGRGKYAAALLDDLRISTLGWRTAVEARPTSAHCAGAKSAAEIEDTSRVRHHRVVGLSGNFLRTNPHSASLLSVPTTGCQ